LNQALPVGLTWPDYFPDDCPPGDAQVADGEVYRLVSQNPPLNTDFRPRVIEQTNGEYSSNLCKACGLSVFRDLSDIEETRRYSGALKNKIVAKGTLIPEAGVLKTTPNARRGGKTHSTWWVPDEFDPTHLFQVIENE